MQEWLDALYSAGRDPQKKDGGRYYVARCPAHDDDRHSLSIKPGDKVSVVVNCFVGCTFKEIASALGMRPESQNTRPKQKPDSKHRSQSPDSSSTQRARTEKELPSGPNIRKWKYVDRNGKVVFAVVRSDPGKRFSQWTPVKGGWALRGPEGKKPLYRLPDILRSSGTVAVVEGEKDVENCRRAWPTQAVTTFAGGCASWARTDWAPLSGRSVSILTDADEVNEKTKRRAGPHFTMQLAAHLHSLGCKVRVGIPEPDNESDVSDWIEQLGPEGAARRVAELLKDFEPPADDQRALPDNQAKSEQKETSKANENDESPDDTLIDPAILRINEHYRILGLERTRVAIKLLHAGQIETFSRKEMTQESTLIAMAPEIWWCKLSGAAEMTKKGARRFGDTLIREADSLGQVDTSEFLGLGAARLLNGETAYHLGDRMLQRGAEISLDDFDAPTIAGPPIELAEKATLDDMREFARAFLAYRWHSKEDGRRMLSWMAVSIIGGAVEWRPHVYFTAAPATGKSWILKRIVRFMGPLALHISNASAAAVSRLTAHTSLPLLVDEANAEEEWVQHLFELMRISAGADGMRVRAGSGGNDVTIQRARFCALVTTHARRSLEAADETRVVPVRLGAPVENWVKVKDDIERAMRLSAQIRSRIIQNMDLIVRNTAEMSRLFEERSLDSRQAMLTGALSAGWRVWGIDSNYVYPRESDFDIIDHGVMVLHEILNLRHRDAGAETDLMTFMLERPKEAAQLYGVRIDRERDLVVACQHPGLSGGLRRTRLQNMDVAHTLMQIKGAQRTSSAVHFGNRRLRAIVIPQESLNALGINIAGGSTANVEEQPPLS